MGLIGSQQTQREFDPVFRRVAQHPGFVQQPLGQAGVEQRRNASDFGVGSGADELVAYDGAQLVPAGANLP